MWILSPFVPRLSATGPENNGNVKLNYTHKEETLTNRIINVNYHQNKLILSNDIEENPGPAKQVKPKLSQTLFIMLLLVLLAFTKTSDNDTIHRDRPLQQSGLSSIMNLLILKFKNHKFKNHNFKNHKFKNHKFKDHSPNLPAVKSTPGLFVILLMISGDIHANPGPPDKEIPTTAKQSTVTCETCLSQYEQDTGIEKSFEWICTNPTCRPNHSPAKVIESHVNENTYMILQNDEHLLKATRKKTSNAKNKKPARKKANHKSRCKDINLLSELTKITSKDYRGKDLCTGCYKEVKDNQQAISCDLCERWIHRGCSDMSIQLYNKCRKKKYFTWVCPKCRKEEILIEDKLEIKNFDLANLPDDYITVQKSKKELLIVQMNCRSINNKNEELENIIQSLDPDILCLTETWMDDSVPLQANTPDGYCMIRKDRAASFKQKYGRNKGGGVAILHKKHIKVETKPYLTEQTEEVLWVHVKVKESFMLGVIYRAEYTDLLNEDHEETKIEENIRKACEISNNLIVTGDFNIDMLDQSNKNTQILDNIYGSYGLSQYVNKATRIDKNTFKPTIIDHVWSTAESQLIKSSGTFIGISDHLGIYTKLNRSKPAPPKITTCYRDYRNYNAEALRTQLQTNLEDSHIYTNLDNKDVNSATDTLINVIQTTVDLHAPLVEKNLRYKPKYIPWFTNDLKDMIKEKNELLQDYFSHSLQSYKTRLKNLGNKITMLKRNLKKKYITEKLEEADGDGRKSWNLINSISGRQKIKRIKNQT